MNEGEQVLVGLLLSDGSVTKVPYSVFQVSFSGMRHLLYLAYLKEVLPQAGLSFGDSYPNVVRYVSKGRTYEHCYLSSLTCTLLNSLRNKWYPRGKKDVPKDILLAPIILAHWFMGDGCSFRVGKNKIGVEVQLATCAFSEDSIALLEAEFCRLGISTSRCHNHRVHTGSGINIYIKQRSVDNFMRIVEPYVMEPFTYKVKYRGVLLGV